MQFFSSDGKSKQSTQAPPGEGKLIASNIQEERERVHLHLVALQQISTSSFYGAITDPRQTNPRHDKP